VLIFGVSGLGQKTIENQQIGLFGADLKFGISLNHQVPGTEFIISEWVLYSNK